MYKRTTRAIPGRIIPSQTLYRSSKRCIITAPPVQKSRSWKSSAARWAIAAGGLYYYSTSNVFAEEPEAAIHQFEDSVHAVKESNQPTLDAIVQEKRARQAQSIAEEQKARTAALAESEQAAGEDEEDGEGGIEGLEQEAGQQGAFNEETGEINWDCPCLGGMAHGPCGEEFKAAFSCFVYSKDEPKGIECIDKFKGMQDCFRQHPETYASELADDEDENEELQEQIRERDTADSVLGTAGAQPSEMPQKSSRIPAESSTSLKERSTTSERSDGKHEEPLPLKETSTTPENVVGEHGQTPRSSYNASQ
ncbi:hypothetical protein BJ878DRAFT_145828 [Calycina marina]|uniref:Mitochondrial intermembrane space import and assembly protein 40 n=1 Tax=Calycina marina TaxID=1763456 RepID=A0A9P7Z984_9HELO|nr:hypothetical protein BJ878DRAFT_145828 [Calycina marina]